LTCLFDLSDASYLKQPILTIKRIKQSDPKLYIPLMANDK